MRACSNGNAMSLLGKPEGPLLALAHGAERTWRPDDTNVTPEQNAIAPGGDVTTTMAVLGPAAPAPHEQGGEEITGGVSKREGEQHSIKMRDTPCREAQDKFPAYASRG